MTSPEKVLLFLEEMQGYSDKDIAEALPLPVPPMALRGALAAVAGRVPDDAKELDALLTRLGEFVLGMRSDMADAALAS